MVRQDIILQPLSEPVLFGIHPVYASPQTPEDIRVNVRTEQLFCRLNQEDRPRAEYRYALATTGLVGGVQLDVTPLSGRVTNLMDPALLAFDPSRFPTLKKTADEVVNRRGVVNGKRADVARALRDHFLRPDAYRLHARFLAGCAANGGSTRSRISWPTIIPVTASTSPARW